MVLNAGMWYFVNFTSDLQPLWSEQQRFVLRQKIPLTKGIHFNQKDFFDNSFGSWNLEESHNGLKWRMSFLCK
jgi:hypothetical protein